MTVKVTFNLELFASCALTSTRALVSLESSAEKFIGNPWGPVGQGVGLQVIGGQQQLKTFALLLTCVKGIPPACLFGHV